MQKGKAGMGSHKHGTSGVAGRSPKFRQAQLREANAAVDAEAERVKRREKANPKFQSVSELFAKIKPR